MPLYMLFCALYRASSGALLLLIGWHLATAEANNFDALALATLLSFVPALAVPLLFKLLPVHGFSKQISAICFAALAAASWLVSRTLGDSSALVALMFFLWLLFFALEPLIEAWFTHLVDGQSEARINRYSSLSMTINQCCLMIGPLIAYGLVDLIGAVRFVEGLALLFGLMAIANVLIMPPVGAAEDREAAPVDRSAELRIILPLCLIWPILGCFNFMVPVYFALDAAGNMAKVGVVDACMGIGMAVAGAVSLSPLFARLRWRNYLSLLLVLAGTLLWWLSRGNIVGCAVATIMLGCGFGAMRIACRSFLAQNFLPSQVASLVSRANAFALFILFLGLLLSKLDFTLSWLTPFALSLGLVLAVSLTFNTNPKLGCIDELS